MLYCICDHCRTSSLQFCSYTCKNLDMAWRGSEPAKGYSCLQFPLNTSIWNQLMSTLCGFKPIDKELFSDFLSVNILFLYLNFTMIWKSDLFVNEDLFISLLPQIVSHRLICVLNILFILCLHCLFHKCPDYNCGHSQTTMLLSSWIKSEIFVLWILRCHHLIYPKGGNFNWPSFLPMFS